MFCTTRISVCYDTHIAISARLDVPIDPSGLGGGGGMGDRRGSRKLAIAGINQMGAEHKVMLSDSKVIYQ